MKNNILKSIFIFVALLVSTSAVYADTYISASDYPGGSTYDCLALFSGTDANGNTYYYQVDGVWSSYTDGTGNKLCLLHSVVKLDTNTLIESDTLTTSFINSVSNFVMQNAVETNTGVMIN